VNERIEEFLIGYLMEPSEREPGWRPAATVFFVTLQDLGAWWTYAVTARHAVEDSDAGRLQLRINRLGAGPAFSWPAPPPQLWHTHDHADVAAVLFDPQDLTQEFLSAMMPISAWIGADTRFTHPLYPKQQLSVTVGDEVKFFGLFAQLPDYGRNLPVFRFGRVSRLPGLINLTRRRARPHEGISATATRSSRSSAACGCGPRRPSACGDARRRST